MPGKRIAILGTRGIPARYGGFETFAEELGARLVERGFRVTVVCEKVRGASQPPTFRGIDLAYVPAPRLGPLTTIAFDLMSLWRVRKGYDVVYMLGYGASLFCFIPRLGGAEVWINMDGIEWLRSKWSWAARAYLRLIETVATWTPNRIIADADAIRSHLQSRHRRLPECTVVPYGSDLVTAAPPEELLAEWGLKVGEYYILVCRLEPENHVLDIVEGYAASSSTFPLVVLGDHKLNTPYVRLLQSVADPRVRLIGTVYDKVRLRALRFHARAYLHGHSVGGTNPSLLEAMGSGNVVIAHDNVFNREVAADAALYFRNARDIPGILEILEADSGRRQRMREVARHRVESIYNWRMIADRYEQLLGSR